MARSTPSKPRNTGGRPSAAPARSARTGSARGGKPGRAPRSDGRGRPGTSPHTESRARRGAAAASGQRTRAKAATTSQGVRASANATQRARSGARGSSARGSGVRGGATTRRRPGGRRRNPNRWRFYVLLVLLALIAAAVLWFTVGRDAVAAYRQTDAPASAERSQSAPAGSERDDAPTNGDAPGTAPEEAGSGTAPPEDAEPDAHALANPVQCRAEALDMAVHTEGRIHDAGEPVAIRVAVTNNGAVPCLVDMGHEEMAVVITSGNDQVWHSDECPRGEGQRRLLLDIGADVAHTLTWPGERCGGGSAGEGTYRIATELNAEAGPARAQTVIDLR